MPYYTTGNQGLSQIGDTLAKIFVGDPAADAALRDQQIKNETEFLRQKQLQEQTLTEAVRRKQIEAAAAANQGLANQRTRENSAHESLGKFFTQDHRNFDTQGGMSMPGDAPAGTPGAGIDLNDPTIAGQIVGNVMRGGIDPKILSSIALMPGQSDDVLGRIMTGSGQKIGKDDYVSVNDRNTNRNYELGAGERLIGGDGTQRAGVDASYSGAQKALENQRNATAGFQNRRSSASAGSKVPRLDQTQMNSMIQNALLAQGAELPAVEGRRPNPAEFLSAQPELYQDMSTVIDNAYRLSGGRASAVQDALSQYLNGMDFTNFGKTAPNGVFTGWFDGKDGGTPLAQPLARPDVNAVIQKIMQQYGQGIDPTIFTEGGDAGLPNLQNVGNGGWNIIPVGE